MLRRLLGNVLLALGYTAVYAWCYVTYLFPNYGSVGFDLFPRSFVFLLASFIIAVLPVVFYRGARAVSSVLTVFVYLILYVPVIITFALASEKPLDEIILIQLTFLVGMSLIILSDIAVVKNPFRLNLRYDLMPLVFGLTVVSIIYILIIYRGSLRFPSFGADLYTVRAENAALGSGIITRYLSSWLATVLVPLCLAHGLTKRKLRYVVIGAAACLVMYVSSAGKISIVLPVVFVGFYLFARTRMSVIYPMITVALSFVIIGLVFASKLSSVLFIASTVILMRTIGNGGQLTVAYYDFFASHPQTDYSHVSGISALVHRYPYGNLGVGEVIGQFYWSPFMVANASFWATDGIAAMGLAGVIIASIACAVVFAIINTVTREYDTLFAVLCFLPFLSTLLNQSLFSSVWSGGAFFLLVFLLLNRPDASTQRLVAA